MTTGLTWAIILGAVATIGIFSLIPLWIAIRFPDRASHDRAPGYLRGASVTVLPRPRTASGSGGMHTKAAA